MSTWFDPNVTDAFARLPDYLGQHVMLSVSAIVLGLLLGLPLAIAAVRSPRFRVILLAVIGLWAGAPPAVVLALFLAFSFFNAMVGTLTGVYPGEVFPTEVRGVGTGFAAAVSRIGAGLGTFLLPWAMVNLGPAASMLIAAGVAFVGAALSQWLAPETKGKSLTEAAAGFSH